MRHMSAHECIQAEMPLFRLYLPGENLWFSLIPGLLSRMISSNRMLKKGHQRRFQSLSLGASLLRAVLEAVVSILSILGL